MPAKQRYVIQTNRTGGATFRVPLDKEASVRDAMQVISTRMSSILKEELRATNVLISKTNLFEEDTLEDVADPDEMLYVELVDAMSLTAGGNEAKFIDMSEEKRYSEEIKDSRSDEKQQRGSTTNESKHSEQKLNTIDAKHVNSKSSSCNSSSGGVSREERAELLFYESFAAALQAHLPPSGANNKSPSPVSALRDKVTLASQVRRAKRDLQGRGARGRGKDQDKHEESSPSSSTTPSMCLVSFLSTWATDMLALMQEARRCFDFHHLAHGDEALLQPTPLHIYEEWLLEVPSIRTHGSISLVTWFRELETLKAEEVESAAYIDAFAATLHASPHDLNSQYALAERVHASHGSSSEHRSRGDPAAAALYKWAMEFLALFKEVKACSDFFQLSHKRKDQPSGGRSIGLTPASAFEEWMVELPDSDGVGLVEKNLLEWYWDLQRTHEREADAALCLDAFAAAVDVPVNILKTDLSRAYALLHQLGHCHRPRQEGEGEEDEASRQEKERQRAWATYYVQLMKEVKTCFVFDQLSHGNERMKASRTSKEVFQEWTIDIDVINSSRLGSGGGQVLSVGLVQWYYDIAALLS